VVYVRCQFVKDLVSGNVVSNQKKKSQGKHTFPNTFLSSRYYRRTTT